MKMINSLFITLLAILLITSCGKDRSVGPQGTTGDKGAPGPAGPAGTANVIYSDWVYATNFRDTIANLSLLKVCDLAAPKLTQVVLDKDTVAVYYNFGDGDIPYPIPVIQVVLKTPCATCQGLVALLLPGLPPIT